VPSHAPFGSFQRFDEQQQPEESRCQTADNDNPFQLAQDFEPQPDTIFEKSVSFPVRRNKRANFKVMDQEVAEHARAFRLPLDPNPPRFSMPQQRPPQRTLNELLNDYL